MAMVAKALGDPVRMQLVDVLRKHAGKVCVCELVPLFDLSQPTVSHHLKKLREAGIVGSERAGPMGLLLRQPRCTGGAERMAELNTVEDKTTSSCCSAEAQESCCEPEAKSDCCGATTVTAAAAQLGRSGDVRERVRERYAAAAVTAGGGDTACCGDRAVITDEQRHAFGAALYEDADRESLPDRAELASLGCGNPTAVAELHDGETVLDLGSGGGIDVLLSARRVAPTGRAIGLDMTDEMLELARRNQAEAGIENAEFIRGTIEDDPAPRRLGRRRDLELRDQPQRRQGRRDPGGRARSAARGPLRGQRRDRRPRHGRGDARRHAAVDGMHRGRSDERGVRP